MMDAFNNLVLGFLYLLLYLLPAIIANIRKARNGNTIFMVNFLFGWTIIGWLLALSWALDSGKKTEGIANSAPTDDRLSQLERLSKLRSNGILNDGEFESEKKKIMG